MKNLVLRPVPHRRRYFALSAAIAISVLAVGGSALAQGQRARGRCCFAVSVDVGWELKLDYHGNGPGAYSGFYEDSVSWSTRFIAAYTGHGLDTQSFGFGLEGGTAGETSQVLVMHKANDPKPTPKYCSDSYDSYSNPAEGTGALIPSAGPFVADRAHVNGFARTLDVFYPDASELAQKCGTAIEGPANHGLMAPGALTLRAPSVNNLLNGSSFDRTCYETVQVKNHEAPFPHDFTGAVFFEVRFTHFHHSELAARERALHKHLHIVPATPAALNQAENEYLSGASDNTWTYDPAPTQPGALAPLHCT